MIPTGWIVAIAVYVVAMMWVPIVVRAAGNHFFGGLGNAFFWKYVVPPLMMVFWPITLVIAIITQPR
jgi:hypothetical protein